MFFDLEPNLRKFFENTARMRHEIQSTPNLVEVIRDCVGSGRFPDEQTYQSLMPRRVGLKGKELYGVVEACVTADLYREDLPISSFVIIVHEDTIRDVALYLVEDFGTVTDIPCPPWGIPQVPPNLCADYDRFSQILRSKGYLPQIGDGEQRSFGIADGGRRLVIHDLDCNLGHMKNSTEIYDGAKYGEGNFARLAKIYAVLRSPEFRINL